MKIRRFRKLISPPILVEKPKGKNILVLAPHFDDETLGCGGSIRKHVLAKDKVSVIFVTDGSLGIPEMKDKKKVTEIRKKETNNALDVLGVNDIYYLYEKDGGLKINKNSIFELIKLLKKLNPDLIYLPWYLDDHWDHIKTNHILYKSLKISKLNLNKINICAYEAWSPLIPNLIVDITKVFKTKEKAIKCYPSQLNEVDYLSAIRGLNKYRTIYNLRGKGYAEAFLFLPVKKYFSLFKRNR